MTPSERARYYAESILKKEIPAGQWVRLACERFIRDLARKDWPYVYDPVKADRAVRFMEKLPHIKGKWASRKEKLHFEPWQCFSECNLFGWVNRETGFRRFRESFELVPRKNAKSTKAAGRGIYMLCADGEYGAEIYAGATTEKQALEVFKPAWSMVNKTPKLIERFGIGLSGNYKNPGPIYVEEDMSRFEPLVGKPGDGASPHGALIDEYHEHDTDHMVETMKTGMGAREQPLLSVISTAGSNLGGPCFEKQQDVQKILDGRVEDETIFAIIYGLDPEDRWDDPKSLIKANPNYGISIYPEFLLSQLEQARRSATKQNSFRTKHLNEWVGAKTAWMNMLAWQRQKKDMRMEDFRGVPCRVSTDLSSKKDVTSIDITFQRDSQYFSFKKFFAPEDAAYEFDADSEKNEKYQEFAAAGFLELTPGAKISQELIEDYLKELNKNYNVIDFTFDEWQAEYMMSRLAALKVEVVKFPFKTQFVSEPMKMLEAFVLDGKYWHDGNPVMTWMMGNVAARENSRGDLFPNKARPNDKRCKIDGPVTSIMSMARFMTNEAPPKEFEVYFMG